MERPQQPEAALAQFLANVDGEDTDAVAALRQCVRDLKDDPKSLFVLLTSALKLSIQHPPTGKAEDAAARRRRVAELEAAMGEAS